MLVSALFLPAVVFSCCVFLIHLYPSHHLPLPSITFVSEFLIGSGFRAHRYTAVHTFMCFQLILLSSPHFIHSLTHSLTYCYSALLAASVPPRDWRTPCSLGPAPQSLATTQSGLDPSGCEELFFWPSPAGKNTEAIFKKSEKKKGIVSRFVARQCTYRIYWQQRRRQSVGRDLKC